MPEPPFFDGAEVQHSDCVWVFCGQNTTGSGAMAGRPEHVDEVDHAGTWHVQHSGSKLWLLRPNPTGSWPTGASPTLDTPDGRLHVLVEAGDFLMINTRTFTTHTLCAAIFQTPQG